MLLPSQKSQAPGNNCSSDNPLLFFEEYSSKEEFPFNSCEDFEVMACCCLPILLELLCTKIVKHSVYKNKLSYFNNLHEKTNFLLNKNNEEN